MQFDDAEMTPREQEKTNNYMVADKEGDKLEMEACDRLDLEFKQFAADFKRIDDLVRNTMCLYPTSEIIQGKSTEWKVLLSSFSLINDDDKKAQNIGLNDLDLNAGKEADLDLNARKEAELIDDDLACSGVNISKKELDFNAGVDVTPTAKYDETPKTSIPGPSVDATPIEFTETQFSSTFLNAVDQLSAYAKKAIDSGGPVYDQTLDVLQKDKDVPIYDQTPKNIVSASMLPLDELKNWSEAIFLGVILT